MELFIEYGLFLVKVVTLVLATFLLFAGIVGIASRGKSGEKKKLRVKSLNDKFDDMRRTILDAVDDKS